MTQSGRILHLTAHMVYKGGWELGSFSLLISFIIVLVSAHGTFGPSRLAFPLLQASSRRRSDSPSGGGPLPLPAFTYTDHQFGSVQCPQARARAWDSRVQGYKALNASLHKF